MSSRLLCLLLIFLLSAPVVRAQQPVAKARQSSYFTKTFRLTDAQARQLYEQGLSSARAEFFTQVVDSFATDSAQVPRPMLPLGYYLVAHTEGPQLVYWLRSETDRQVIVLDNQVDLSVLVRDTLGRPLTDAQLRLHGHMVPYDAASGVFRRARRGRPGLLALTVGGRTTYHALTRNAAIPGHGRSRGYWHRLGNRLLYGFPVGYASRPGQQFVRDLHHASGVNTGLIGLLRSVFNEDVRDERQERRSDPDNHSGHQTHWTGYLALSQPRYRPHGDTLRLKARVLRRRNGHPYSRPLGLWLGTEYGQRERRLAILRPVRPGSYELVLPLPDSLNLKSDTQPTLRLRTRRGRQLLETTFRAEDYELDDTHYALRLAHAEHRAGEAQAVYLRGTDANELSLLDARLHLALTPNGQPGPFAGRQLFVPDTLFTHRQPLDAVGETRVNVPESSFPAADLAYTVTGTFLNADNERHQETAPARRHLDPGQLRLELRADSVLLRYEWAGRASVPHAATLTVRGSATGGPAVALVTQRLTLPARLLLDPRAIAYEVADSAGRVAQLALTETNAAVALNAERTTDSLFLHLDNPRRLPVRYFLYRGNRLVRRGQGAVPKLQLALRAAGSEPWYVSLHYWWGDKMRAAEYTVPLARHQLTVRAEQAAVAYPGQRLELQYTVTDVAGRPVPDADLTSYAYTSKFARADVPRLPNYEPYVPGRASRRRFGLAAGFENDAEKPAAKPLPWAAWRGRLGLDSLRFYQFLYPEGGFFYEYRKAPAGLTQFAPFVLDHGVEVPILAIYVNGLPVWIHDVSAPEAYSVVAAAGLCRLSLRTAEHLLTLPEMFLRAGCKLTLSVDINAVCQEFKIEKRGSLRPEERLNLARSLVLFEQNETLKHAFPTWHAAGEAGPLVLGQGQRWQQVRWNNGSGSWLAGPFRPDSVALRRADGLRATFVPEPLYHYRFRSGEMRLRSAVPGDYGLLTGSGYDGHNGLRPWEKGRLPLGDFALSPAQVLASLQPQSAPEMWPAVPIIIFETKPGQGRLLVRQPGWPRALVPALPAVRWLRLISVVKGAKPRYAPGNRAFEGLAPGAYRLVLLLADSSTLAPAEPVLIQPNGTTYVQLLAADHQPPGPQGHAFNRQLRRDFALPPVPPIRKEMRTERPVNVPFSWQTVVGRVVDISTNQGLPGVTVLVKGTTLGSSTNAKGDFELAMPNAVATLAFSSVGFVSQERAVHADEQVFIGLSVDSKQLEEVVVVGYGTQRRSDLTASVSTTMLNTLSGKVSGVNIGNTGWRITIRGSSALSSSVAAPLLIVNGLPMNIRLADLDPAAIASMSVLSGASAVGMYGSRASGGVIIITTKTGMAAGPGVIPGLPTGPEGGSDPRLALRRNFRDYAWWRPTLVTDAQGQARTTVILPDDVTGWDTFALVSDDHGRLGSATARLRAFKALRAELAVPRFLVAGDEVRILGKTLNYLPDTAQVVTSFRVGDGPARTQAHRVATSVLDTLTVAAPATGADSIQLTYSLRQPSGYQDGEQRTVPILPAGSRETVGTFAVLTAADTTLTLPVDPRLGEVQVRIEADALPVLLREIEHLNRYAYLCNEQMASKLIGLLLSQRIMALQHQPFTQEKNVRILIRRLLAGRHQPEGLWGTWPQAAPSPWATLHVLDALLAAEKQGYAVKFERGKVRAYLLSELDLTFDITTPKTGYPAYTGYFRLDDDRLRLLQLLHCLGAPLDYASYLLRLGRGQHGRQPLDRALALTEFRQQLQLPVRLDSLRRFRFATQLGGVFYADTLHPTSYYQHLLAGRIAATLQVYRILRTAGGQTAELLRLRTFLLNQRNGGHWASTYETAQILETIGPDLLAGSSTALLAATVELGGGGEAGQPVALPYVAKHPARAGSLTLHKQGALPVYATVYQTRWNPAPAAQAAPFTVSSVLDGQRGNSVRLKAGQPVELVVTVDVRAEARYVLLEIPVPAGCSYAPHAAPNRYETHREYLRHQTGIFLDLLPVGRHTFRVALQPRYPGRYTLNPAKAELVYFPTRFGREASKRVTVR
ncbi:carboxypeptidase-like regulatory domain-containing protein [Hymenobacter terricola]|uniref:carboxypeptidase-like regulatory domain-containing protein n=1 Tax=Hymenobacter terricola TaxID=2819236 RepID=UPI001B30DC53|nr:carboxypeptidase-like regulatory domain-containing protein [Hymenobacter terricola]